LFSLRQKVVKWHVDTDRFLFSYDPHEASSWGSRRCTFFAASFAHVHSWNKRATGSGHRGRPPDRFRPDRGLAQLSPLEFTGYDATVRTAIGAWNCDRVRARLTHSHPYKEH
jgi:hypothetical protein